MEGTIGIIAIIVGFALPFVILTAIYRRTRAAPGGCAIFSIWIWWLAAILVGWNSHPAVVILLSAIIAICAFLPNMEVKPTPAPAPPPPPPRPKPSPNPATPTTLAPTAKMDKTELRKRLRRDLREGIIDRIEYDSLCDEFDLNP